MLTASARPDPNAPFARAEIIVRGLPSAPTTPSFQLRRSNVDYVEPNLDLTGWTRAEVTLLPLDAWWLDADRSFHLLVSGLLCQFIDPGPLKLRLAAGEIDLFWPEDISVYDDGTLAAHARVLTDTVRVVTPERPAPPPPPEPTPPPAPAPPSPNPWAVPPPPVATPKPKRMRWRGIVSILLPITVGAAVVGAVAIRHRPGIPPERLAPIVTPPRAVQSRPDHALPDHAPPDHAPPLRAALDRVIGELPAGRHSDFDPFLAVRPPGDIIAQTSSPEALLRYGVTKLDQREPVAADRLFEEATRPRFGPAQNRPYPPAFVVRALLYDPSIQHDMILPVPNAAFSEILYRRAIAAGDPQTIATATASLQHLTAWQAQHPAR